MDYMYYFGYGSNLSGAQMQERCPNSKFFAIGRLDGYRLLFDGFSRRWQGGVANIAPDDRGLIWGTVYTMTPDDVAHMDKYECYPKDYQRREERIMLEGSRSIKALLYFRKPKQEHAPSYQYIDQIIRGAREHNLPSGYITQRLLPLLKDNES